MMVQCTVCKVIYESECNSTRDEEDNLHLECPCCGNDTAIDSFCSLKLKTRSKV